MGRRLVMVLFFAAACSEYQLSDKDDPTPPFEEPDDTGTPPDTYETPAEDTAPEDTPEDTAPEDTLPVDTVPVETGTPPQPSCDDVVLPVMQWVGSPTFATAPDPVDGGGTVFWDPTADTSAWEPIILPDRAIPIGEDRAYVGLFDLPEVPLNLSLNLQSDDGITVWLNGTRVGQWGGGWQLEGCVNENAQCLVTIRVDPVDVTPLLHVGTNVLAARVSNPVENAYFEIIPECVEP